MALPLWAPLREVLAASAGDAAGKAATTAATGFLAVVAAGFLVSAAVVALSAVTGFPVAALLFAVLFAGLALGVHLFGRMRSARRTARIAAAQSRAVADLALATTLARSARPLLPIAAFVAAFLLARRS